MGLEDRLMTSFKGALKRANAPFWHTDFLPTGIFPADHAMGGGFGYGRVAEVFGGWSSGKTMLLYLALIQNIQRGGVSILAEAEGAFSPDFFSLLGGDPERLLVFPIDTVEEFFDMVITICKDQAKESVKLPIALGWDGIAATGTKHLAEVGMDKRDMSKASAMSTGCQLIRTKVKECRMAVVATNQTREKIGSNDSATHTPGGIAWPFLSSQRIELKFMGGTKGSTIFDRKGVVEIGKMVRGMVVKNKLASPFGKFVLPIYTHSGFWHPAGYEWGTQLGIDKIESLFENYANGYITFKGRRVLTASGGWYKVDEEIAPGSKSFYSKDWPQVLEQYPQLWGTLNDLKNIGTGSTESVSNPPDTSDDGESETSPGYRDSGEGSDEEGQ